MRRCAQCCLLMAWPWSHTALRSYGSLCEPWILSRLKWGYSMNAAKTKVVELGADASSMQEQLAAEPVVMSAWG